MIRILLAIAAAAMVSFPQIRIKTSFISDLHAGQHGSIIRYNHDSLEVSAKAFGAVGDGQHDDWPALQAMANYMIRHAANGILPVGI